MILLANNCSKVTMIMCNGETKYVLIETILQLFIREGLQRPSGNVPCDWVATPFWVVRVTWVFSLLGWFNIPIISPLLPPNCEK